MDLIDRFLGFIEAVGIRIRTLFFRIFFWAFDGKIQEVWKRSNIQPNGSNPWDPQFKDQSALKEFRARLLGQGTLGLAESYMEGLWKVEDLEEMLFRLFRADTYNFLMSPLTRFSYWFLYKLFNLQTKELAKRNIKMHYEIHNKIIRASIGPSLNYTCAEWKDAKNLEEAQTNKMELIAQKLKLKPGMRVLDIGCGWGALCKYLAENHGVTVVGVNICKESVAFAKDYCKGLPIEIHEMDYRDAPAKLGQFDRVTCIEMFEHVGISNYKTYFETVNKCLVEDGHFLLQVISARNENMPQVDPFSNKYIFGSSMVPFPNQIVKYSQGFLVLEDWMFWGYNYQPTLMVWWKNFDKAWPKLQKETGNNEIFYRMWKMYLMSAAAGYRARIWDNYQIVFSKEGSLAPYYSVR